MDNTSVSRLTLISSDSDILWSAAFKDVFNASICLLCAIIRYSFRSKMSESVSSTWIIIENYQLNIYTAQFISFYNTEEYNETFYQDANFTCELLTALVKFSITSPIFTSAWLCDKGCAAGSIIFCIGDTLLFWKS